MLLKILFVFAILQTHEKHRYSKSRDECPFHDQYQLQSKTQRPSQQTLSSQFDLPQSLTLLPPSFTNTYSNTLGKLDFVLDIGKRTRAVVWEMDTSKCPRTEIIGAMC